MAASAGIIFLWEQVLILSLLLIILALIKHRFFPMKQELSWYLGFCIGGAVVEILMVNIGHGWSYVKPQLFNIPIWMPLFWGLTGTTVIVFYTEITKKP